MATAVYMPKFGMTQVDATVVRWLRHEGDRVERGERILEVETDKAIMEVEAPAGGILRGIRAQAQEVVPVAATIAYITAHGEALPEGETGGATSPPRAPAPVRSDTPDRPTWELPGDGRLPEGPVKVRATPAARRTAREEGVDLAQLTKGSGPRGRIQRADVLAAARQGMALSAPPAAAVSEGAEAIPFEGLRRRIATRLQASYQTAPHITLTVEADMRAALALLTELNAAAGKAVSARISVTAVLVRACARALRRTRWVNASLQGEEIHVHRSVNVGVAVALEDGLVVPVVRDADRLGLRQIAARLEELAERARAGRLMPDDVTGGTFTLTNLGMYGVSHFAAIIKPPEAAILSVGRIAKRAVVAEGPKGDEIVVRPLVVMTLSADHRVLDGAVAARFLQDVVHALEHPGALLL